MMRYLFVVLVAGSVSAGTLGNGFPQSNAARGENALDGQSVYVAYCGACHGADGKGHGPAAAAMNPAPVDLTVIARNNLGEFPRASIEDVLMNGGKWKAHGSKEMPVWGPVFRTIESNDNLGFARVHNVVTYLESIQAK